jgi:large subunit ribosomal protein L37Ae
MAKEAKLKGAKRFGARYGRTVKYLFDKIESEQRRYHECPYCKHIKVKRVAYGIWECRKCNAKFTGKAYTLSKSTDVTKEPDRITIIGRESKKVVQDEDIDEEEAQKIAESKQKF